MASFYTIFTIVYLIPPSKSYRSKPKFILSRYAIKFDNIYIIGLRKSFSTNTHISRSVVKNHCETYSRLCTDFQRTHDALSLCWISFHSSTSKFYFHSEQTQFYMCCSILGKFYSLDEYRDIIYTILVQVD